MKLGVAKFSRMTQVALIVGTAAIFAGCGSSNSSSPESQIRENEHQMLGALKGNNFLKFCSFSSKPGECIASMAMAKAFLGSGKITDLLSDQQLKAAEKALDTEPIQVSQDGTRATVDNGDGSSDTWVKQSGEWKIVLGSS